MEASSDDSGFEEPTPSARKAPAPRPSEPILFRPLTPTNPPPAIPLSGFEHSLVPDMAMGWRPTTLRGGPVPLVFSNCDLPVSINPVTKKEFPTIYHGFRPRDTMVMHQSLSSNSYPTPSYPSSQVYEYLNKRDQRLQDTRPFLGMNPDCDCELLFDSFFESGNLDRVVQIAPCEFDVYIRVDSNTTGHFQWFYFSVLPQRAKLARFNLVNISRNEGQFAQGMLPSVFIENQPGLGWHHAGIDPKHAPSKLNKRFAFRKGYNSMSFSYQFRPDMGKVYFAYGVPYTYSFLINTIGRLCNMHPRWVRRDGVGKTLSGLELPSLTITNFSTGVQKPHVVLMARIHPGETYSSWLLHVTSTQGFLHFLVSLSPVAIALREKLVFIIVPMANPDGVIIGNFKTGIAGDDLNRQFSDPQVSLHPTVVAIRNLVERLAKDYKIIAFLDFHSHSKKKFVFLYGPHYPLHSTKYYHIRILPKLICEKGPQFRYAACRFRTETRSQASARTVMWKEFQIQNSFTVEASCYGYLDETRDTISFTHEAMEDSGKRIAESLQQFVLLKEQRAKKRRTKKGLRRLKMDQFQQTIEAPVPGSMEELFRQIKEEEKAIEQTPAAAVDSPSDSESSEEESDEQRRIKGEIIAAVELFDRVPKIPTVLLMKPPQRKFKEAREETNADSMSTTLKAYRPVPPLLPPRKQDSERILQSRLYVPLITVRLPVEESPPRAASVLHKVASGRQQGLINIRKNSPEIRPAFMRCPQNGFRDVSPISSYARLPSAVNKVEGVWARHSSRPRNLNNPIVIKPIRHENGAVTDRPMVQDQDSRPRTSLRLRLGAAALNC